MGVHTKHYQLIGLDQQSLDNEVDLKVLEAVTNIHGAEPARSELVEELVAGPLERTNHNLVIALVHLERPAATGLVKLCRLEETLVERCCRKIELSTLCLILHIAEVEVVAEAHA